MLPWLLRIWRQLPTPLKHLYLRVRYGHYAVGVAALIRDAGGRILLVHRTYSYDEPWALPGGWLEGSDDAVENVKTTRNDVTVPVVAAAGAVSTIPRPPNIES